MTDFRRQGLKRVHSKIEAAPARPEVEWLIPQTPLTLTDGRLIKTVETVLTFTLDSDH